MFVESRDDARGFFLRVRRKMEAGEALEPLERVIAQVIDAHPEYHATLDDRDDAMARDYDGSDGRPNPFFHMGLHIALTEQLQTDRPAGVRASYQALLMRHGGDNHAVEHLMMDCLAETLFDASRAGAPPDEVRYLERLRELAR
ncbi:MAG: DUF1841 family protein [Gammaproteobacteria bacterium]